MKFVSSTAALVASLVLGNCLAAAEPNPLTEDIAPRALKALVNKGCYKAVGASMEQKNKDTFQSYGECQKTCVEKYKKGVMALTKGLYCWCGDKLPKSDAKTDKDECNKKCGGFDKDKCGGKSAFTVFVTGYVDEDEIEEEEAKQTSTSESATSTSPPESTSTKSSETVVVTPTGGEEKKSGGPNKAGIAAGVVVGVVALAAIIGGAFFFLKYRKRKEVMEEYRRNANISNFVAGGKPYSEGSMSDSRLDPAIMSQRRQSNGSIADDQDFSRRILKVTNPDGHY